MIYVTVYSTVGTEMISFVTDQVRNFLSTNFGMDKLLHFVDTFSLLTSCRWKRKKKGFVGNRVNICHAPSIVISKKKSSLYFV